MGESKRRTALRCVDRDTMLLNYSEFSEPAMQRVMEFFGIPNRLPISPG